MAQYTVGSVPYVNAIPLTRALERWEEHVVVRYEVPSQLPAMLEGGEADAILVSSIDALLAPGRRMAEGVCIGSDGPVKSVRLFSKVPPRQIRSLALDASSMTSNRLAQILLADGYGVSGLKLVTRRPSLEEMLAECDACVLIGDIGMRTEGTGLHILDMGEEWTRLTGKPFVWAAWIGNERLTPELSAYLNAARLASMVGKSPDQGTRSERLSRYFLRRWFNETDAMVAEAAEPRRQELIAYTAEKTDWPEDVIRDYYLNVMVYEMNDRMLQGLREFQRRLVAFGFSDAVHFPEIVAMKAPEPFG